MVSLPAGRSPKGEDWSNHDMRQIVTVPACRLPAGRQGRQASEPVLSAGEGLTVTIWVFFRGSLGSVHIYLGKGIAVLPLPVYPSKPWRSGEGGPACRTGRDLRGGGRRAPKISAHNIAS